MRVLFISGLKKFRQRTGFQWGGGEIILAGILIFGILSMGSGMFGKWMRASREGGLLMVDLHSFSSADYGVDEMPLSVPAIGLEIIQDLLGVRRPPQTGRPGGIALVTPNALIPTPTVPWSGELPPTSPVPPGENHPTPTPKPTSTPRQNLTPTAIPETPVSTKPPYGPSQTGQPTATSGSSPTSETPTKTPQPPQPEATSTTKPGSATPTDTPPQLPSPTPQPAFSPTPRPTRSSTLAVTPTAVYTPVVSPGPPQIP
jgi:hypothetical protein